MTIPAGGLAFICSVPGHADAGMSGEVMVAARARGDAAAGASMTAEEMRDHDAARTGAFPAETEGKGGQVLEPTILADGTKQWELTASVFQWETEPGKIVEAWGYNGMVPGPSCAPRSATGSGSSCTTSCRQPTTIHFHGLLVPNAMDGVPVISQPRSCPARPSPTSSRCATPAATCTTATSWPSARCRWASWAP